MTEISFNTIPQVLGEVVKKLEEIASKVDNLQPRVSTEANTWFNLKELCEYLPNHPTVKTVYGWTSARAIPFHKQGKTIVFLKREIDKWLLDSKRKTHQELMEEAEAFINRKRRGSMS